MKICKTCLEEKPLSEFHKCAGMADGLTKDCKQCRHATRHDYRKRNEQVHQENNELLRRWEIA